MRDRPFYNYVQSAAMPFRERRGEIQVLMITARNTNRWIIPKTIVHGHPTPQQAAVNAARREAGVVGPISSLPIGSYCYEKWGGTCTVSVYVLQAERLLLRWDQEFRGRKWLSLRSATRMVTDAELSELLSALPGFVQAAQLRSLLETLPEFQRLPS